MSDWNRRFAASLVFGYAIVALFWVFLFFFAGSSDTLYVIAELAVIVTSFAVIVHMIYDRGLRHWESTSVSILQGELGWMLVFGFFAYRTLFGRTSLSPGQFEAWLDAALALVLVGRPFLLWSLAKFRWDKRQRGEVAEPGEILKLGLPERRMYDRREETRAMKAELRRYREKAG